MTFEDRVRSAVLARPNFEGDDLRGLYESWAALVMLVGPQHPFATAALVPMVREVRGRSSVSPALMHGRWHLFEGGDPWDGVLGAGRESELELLVSELEASS